MSCVVVQFKGCVIDVGGGVMWCGVMWCYVVWCVRKFVCRNERFIEGVWCDDVVSCHVLDVRRYVCRNVLSRGCVVW